MSYTYEDALNEERYDGGKFELDFQPIEINGETYYVTGTVEYTFDRKNGEFEIDDFVDYTVGDQDGDEVKIDISLDELKKQIDLEYLAYENYRWG